jgi:hypothetical protein
MFRVHYHPSSGDYASHVYVTAKLHHFDISIATIIYELTLTQDYATWVWPICIQTFRLHT